MARTKSSAEVRVEPCSRGDWERIVNDSRIGDRCDANCWGNIVAHAELSNLVQNFSVRIKQNVWKVQRIFILLHTNPISILCHPENFPRNRNKMRK